MAGREPVARMMRSKLRTTSVESALLIRSVVEFSNAARPWMYSTWRCLESCPKPPVSFFTTPSFQRAQPRQIDLRGRKVDSPIFRLLGFFNQLGDVQQRLRRNAAAVETHAAGIHLRVDQRNLHAQISGEEGGCVAAGSAPTTAMRKLLSSLREFSLRLFDLRMLRS